MPDEPRAFERLGFNRNPFDHAEAENESGLPGYYVKPAYYSDILGEPENQRSWMIFGDYGRGKSALRRQLEMEIRKDPRDRIVCLTYDDFTPLLEAKAPEQVTLRDHTNALLSRGVLALLALVAKREKDVQLDKSQREAARWFVEKFFETLSSSAAEALLDSVSTIDDKVRRQIRQHGGALASVIVNVGLRYLGLPPARLDAGAGARPGAGVAPEDNPLFLFERLCSLLEALGVTAVVVLVDRLDQSGKVLTSAPAIVKFLSPLLWNYNLLELKDATKTRQILGFKFFLPLEDSMKRVLADEGFRFDRILPQEISWSQTDLATIWRRRLEHYSGGRILELGAVCEDKEIDGAILSNARGSPRRMVLMGHYILMEYNTAHSRSPDIGSTIPARCAVDGLTKFAKFAPILGG